MPKRIFLLALATLLNASAFTLSAANAQDAAALLAKAAVPRGVACVPIAGDGKLALDLARSGGWIVLALDEDAARVNALRQAAEKEGLLGRTLYVWQGGLGALPFADHYVDLLVLDTVAENRLSGAQKTEILRVLTPINGRAVLADKTLQAPEIPGSDWWAHKMHGPDNNPVSKDTVFQFPPIQQYRAMPMYTSAQSAMLTANGIHYEINDWVLRQPTRANLCGRIFARNVYNGRILWVADAPSNTLPSMPTAAICDGALLLASGERAEIVRYDGTTGKLLPGIVLGGPDRRVKWFAHRGGILYALLGGVAELKPAFTFFIPPVSSAWEKQTLFGDEIVAWDLAKGKPVWTHKEPAPIDFRNIALDSDRLYFYSEKTRLAALELAGGKPAWENRDTAWIDKLKRVAPKSFYVSNVSSLIAADGLLRFSVAEGKELYFFDAKGGAFLSSVPGEPIKSMILDGKLAAGSQAIDPKTGAKVAGGPPSPAGTAWCGIVTYAPGTGILGHSTMNYKSPCAEGAWVAGGVLAYSPTICDCGAIPGAGGFVSGRDLIGRAAEKSEHPFIEGEAYAECRAAATKGAAGAPEDWPAYRGDYRHRGSSAASVAASAKLCWTSKPAKPFSFSALYNQSTYTFDDRPVAPIVVGKTVFTAGSDGVVAAHSLETGDRQWTFYAGGPVFTPPAWYGGMLFVPCADGWVYALQASTGRLAWKRRLAPMERQILLFDKLASNWPVISLVVRDGIVYAAAGHAVTDGVKTFALDAPSGSVAWSHFDPPATTKFQGSHNAPDKPVQGLGGNLTLAGDRLWGCGYFSPPLVLDRKTGEDPLVALRTSLVATFRDYYDSESLYHVRGQDIIKMGGRALLLGGCDLLEEQQLREGARSRINYRLFVTDERGDWALDPEPAPVFTTRTAPACDDELLAFAAAPSYDEKVGIQQAKTIFMNTTGLNVWPVSRFTETAAKLQTKPTIDKEKTGSGLHLNNAFSFLDFSKGQWRNPELDSNAVVLARNAVLVTCATSFKNLLRWQSDIHTSRQPMIDYGGWKVTAFTRDDGREMWSVDLPSEPLFNGIAVAADGTVIVSLRDGTVAGVK